MNLYMKFFSGLAQEFHKLFIIIRIIENCPLFITPRQDMIKGSPNNLFEAVEPCLKNNRFQLCSQSLYDI